MATNEMMPVSSSKIQIWYAAPSVAEKDTLAKARDDTDWDEITGYVKSVGGLDISASTSDETVLDSGIGQTHKDIPSVALPLGMRGSKPARKFAVNAALASGAQMAQLRISYDGKVSGETFYWGVGYITQGGIGGAARSAQQANAHFVFNTINTGTYA